VNNDGVDAILFDLGGVVFDIDPRKVTAQWAETAACDVALLQTRFLMMWACVTKSAR